MCDQTPLWPSTSICSNNGYCDIILNKCICNNYWTGLGDMVSAPYNDCYIFQPGVTTLWAICFILNVASLFYVALAINTKLSTSPTKMKWYNIPGMDTLISFDLSSFFRIILCILKFAYYDDPLRIGNDHIATIFYAFGSEFFWHGFQAYLRVLASTSKSMVKLTSNLDENKTQELYSLISLINNITYVAQCISLSSFSVLFCIRTYPQYQLELTATHYALKSLNSLFIYLALGWVLPILKEAFDYIDVKDDPPLSVKSVGSSFNFKNNITKSDEIVSLNANKLPIESTTVNLTPDIKLNSASSKDSGNFEKDTIELISPVSNQGRGCSISVPESLDNQITATAETPKPEEPITPKFRRSATMGMGMLQADPNHQSREEKKYALIANNFKNFDTARSRLLYNIFPVLLQCVWPYVQSLSTYTIPIFISISAFGVYQFSSGIQQLDEGNKIEQKKFSNFDEEEKRQTYSRRSSIYSPKSQINTTAASRYEINETTSLPYSVPEP